MSPEQVPSLSGRSTITTVVIVVILIALCLLAWAYRNTPPFSNLFGSDVGTLAALDTQKPFNTVSYSCDQGKTIIAEYYDGETHTGDNGMPVGGGHVVLTLTGGQMMSLPHVVSADGARYANTDESFVFWTKGDGAFIQEGANSTQTYTNCVAKNSTAQ